MHGQNPTHYWPFDQYNPPLPEKADGAAEQYDPRTVTPFVMGTQEDTFDFNMKFLPVDETGSELDPKAVTIPEEIVETSLGE